MTVQRSVWPAMVLVLASLVSCSADPSYVAGTASSPTCTSQTAGCVANGAGAGGAESATSAVQADPGANAGDATGLTGNAAAGSSQGGSLPAIGGGAMDWVPTGSGTTPTGLGTTGDNPQGVPVMQATPTGTPGIPCDAAGILGERCTGCHGAEPKFGAPMPLVTLADFQAAAPSDPARKVFEVIPERIDPADVARRMPPTSLPALEQGDKDSLGTWLDQGAPGVEGGCEITETSLVPDDTPATTTASRGGAHVTPIEYDDPEMECYKFVAHAAGSDRPYSAAPGEAYMNFTFAAPWKGTVYQRAIKVVLDESSKVIHHWLLFKLTGRGSDGAVATGIGAHPDGILLHGWAPGASPIYLDPDVGVKLESNVGYLLEAHYYNSGLTAGPDQSGAEVCVTPQVPEHVAELSWLGTDGIVGSSASGTCSPNIREPVHLLAAQPHMHLKGRHMKVVINRKDRTEEVIHDEDFAFEDQRYYVLDSVLNPGESITTTCSYNGIATFGTSTNSEMCYFFTLHWPAGALRTAGIGTALHGANSCGI